MRESISSASSIYGFNGYTKGVKDYEFILDLLIEDIIQATNEFYPPPGMDSAV